MRLGAGPICVRAVQSRRALTVGTQGTAFVHGEIWHDIDERRFSDAVEDWIVTDGGGNEPWVLLVDADGAIAARWDNVFDADDLTSRLEALPVT